MGKTGRGCYENLGRRGVESHRSPKVPVPSEAAPIKLLLWLRRPRGIFSIARATFHPMPQNALKGHKGIGKFRFGAQFFIIQSLQQRLEPG